MAELIRVSCFFTNLTQAADEGSGKEVWQGIQHEISSLHHTVEWLQSEIQRKQDGFRSEMEALSKKLGDAICIPPKEICV